MGDRGDSVTKSIFDYKNIRLRDPYSTPHENEAVHFLIAHITKLSTCWWTYFVNVGDRGVEPLTSTTSM